MVSFMQEKGKNDALDSTLGFYYQCYVALEDCFNMKENDELFVETDGDVSVISSNGKSFQKEVKHHKNESNLTDKNLEFWKTLYNWITDHARYEKYDKLIFYTTANISNKSIFHNWNNMSLNNRVEILNSLEFDENDYDENVKNFTYYYKNIFYDGKYNHDILNGIIDKIEIDCSNSKISSVKNDFSKYLSFIPESHVENMVFALLGFLIGKIDVENHNWSITRKEFVDEVGKKANFYNPNPNEVPSNYENINIPIEEQTELKKYDFVSKILDINLEKEVDDSIECYWKTQKTIIDFFDKDITHINSLENYRKTINNTLVYTKKSNEVEPFEDENKRIIASQRFFYSMMGYQLINVGAMNNLIFFQKGMMHTIAQETNFKWKLGDDDEN